MARAATLPLPKVFAATSVMMCESLNVSVYEARACVTVMCVRGDGGGVVMHTEMLKATDICSDLRKDQDGSPHSIEAETGGRGAYLNELGHRH